MGAQISRIKHFKALSPINKTQNSEMNSKITPSVMEINKTQDADISLGNHII